MTFRYWPVSKLTVLESVEGDGAFSGREFGGPAGRERDVGFEDPGRRGIAVEGQPPSSFRDHAEYFGEMNHNGRTAEIKVDDTEIVLDLSGFDPVLKTEDGKAFHPSMFRGFMDHMATRTGHSDGNSSSRTCAKCSGKRIAASSLVSLTSCRTTGG